MPGEQMRVFLLCENRLLGEALLRILGKRSNVTVCGACGYSAATLDEVTTANPEIVLLDSLRLAIGQSLLLRQIHQNIAGVRTKPFARRASRHCCSVVRPNSLRSGKICSPAAGLNSAAASINWWN